MSPRPKLDSVRKPQILAAAVDCLYERGYHDTRISDIAERVEIHSSTILHYFSSREALLEEALDYSDAGYYAALQAGVDQHEGAAQKLRWLIEHFSGSPARLDDWTLLMEVWVRARRYPETRQMHQRMEHRLRDVFADIVRLGIAQGEFDEVDADDAALSINCLLDGLGIQRTLEDPTVPPARMARLALDMASRIVGCQLDAARTTPSAELKA